VRTPEGLIGGLALAVAALVAIFAPALSPGDPLDIVGRPLLPPLANSALPLGTDRLGRSIAAILVHGTRATLAIAFAVMLAALLFGALVGAIAGYVGGWLDDALMRLADATQTVPGFVLALALVSVIGPGLGAMVIALAAGAWTGPARIVRAETLALKSRPFVQASRLIGRHPVAIALQVILPNALSPLISLSAIIVAGAILTESALSFLGLGDPNVASWGALIAEGRSVMRSASHVIIVPGLAVAATVLAVSLLGEGLARSMASSDD
jgi:peptide/nickel transport system permease protein